MKLPVHRVENLDLNHASEDQLDLEVGLGPERARRLVESRPLRSWDDVARIEGFTARLAEELQAQGAALGDASTADVKPISDEHKRTLQRAHTAGVDDSEGVPKEGHKGTGPETRLS